MLNVKKLMLLNCDVGGDFFFFNWRLITLHYCSGFYGT